MAYSLCAVAKYPPAVWYTMYHLAQCVHALDLALYTLVADYALNAHPTIAPPKQRQRIPQNYGIVSWCHKLNLALCGVGCHALNPSQSHAQRTYTLCILFVLLAVFGYGVLQRHHRCSRFVEPCLVVLRLRSECYAVVVESAYFFCLAVGNHHQPDKQHRCHRSVD